MTRFGNLSIRLSCIWHVKRTALAQVGRDDFGLSLGHSSIKDLWSREFFSFVFEDCFSRKVAKLATDSGIRSLLVFFYFPKVPKGQGLGRLACSGYLSFFRGSIIAPSGNMRTEPGKLSSPRLKLIVKYHLLFSVATAPVLSAR